MQGFFVQNVVDEGLQAVIAFVESDDATMERYEEEQDQVIDKQEEVRPDVVGEIESTTDSIVSEIKESREHAAVVLQDAPAYLRPHLDRIGKMDEDISRIKARIGM